VSQSGSAGGSLPGPLAARRGEGSPLALRNRPIAARLISLAVIPAVLGLAVAGLRVADDAGSARAYGQAARIAALGQQADGLALDLEQERAATATFIAAGQPGAPPLTSRYAATDRQAAAVRRLARQVGRGYPAPARAAAAMALASVADVPGLRLRAAGGQAAELMIVSGYSAAIAGLFPVLDNIADLGGSPVLSTSARALGALSRMTDQAAQQQAVLGAALAAGRVAPGALTALAVARAQQAGDLAAFRGSATPQESRALAVTLASPLARQAMALAQRAAAAGAGQPPLDASAGQQWRAGTSYTVNWLRQAQRQLAGFVAAYAGSLQRGAQRSAIITGGAAVAALVLVLLVAAIIVRSVVRPLRRLEAAAAEIADTGLPAEVEAAVAGQRAGPPVPLPAVDLPAADEVGRVARAVDRIHREAVRLAGEQARQRGSLSAICASSFGRSYSLLERLFRLVDSMESAEEDPGRLAGLFELDHLATQMRRNADRALVLAGFEIPVRQPGPVTLIDVLRAAASEIEQYDRVARSVQPDVSVAGSAATDIVHLLAELLENGTTFSSDQILVTVSADVRPDGDLVISVTDAGAGIPDGQLQWLNWQLAHPPLADGRVEHHLGLFAVAHLAARHGISVALRVPPGGGVIADVRLPAALISRSAAPAPGGAGAALAAVPAEQADDIPDALPVGAPVPPAAPDAPGAAARPRPARAERDPAAGDPAVRHDDHEDR
jgi:HAMP domain-containing protein